MRTSKKSSGFAARICCARSAPTHAAFNLIGDPDMRGRELTMALTGINARHYKNSTLLFNLARIFIARSPAGEVEAP